jgi:DNA-binding NtrC family response regulator
MSAHGQNLLGRVLVVDDHASARTSVVDALRLSGYSAEACASGAEALKRLSVEAFDVVITDLQMPGMNGLEFIREMERRRTNVPTLMVTAHASIDTAVEAMRYGAFDYMEKPFDIVKLEAAVSAAIKRSQVARTASADSPAMIGQSVAMQQLRERIALVAATEETVLICGESGVGKELIARTIHALSRRAAREMVSLNCPVLSEQLTESELFGHKRGAFTGADADRVGRFELASGSSLLLDEITEINLHLQAKLLRVLQERSFERVGSSETLRVDVRVIATTNRSLVEEISKGRFREDLYYRLAVVPVEAPPLRERVGDVPLLADHFLAAARKRAGGRPQTFTAGAIDLLTSYHWPGNVRELHNVVTRASILSPSEAIEADLMRPWLRMGEPLTATAPMAATKGSESLADMERRVILATLERLGGHRQRTAEALGIGVRTLSGKLRDYGIAPRENTIHRAA